MADFHPEDESEKVLENVNFNSYRDKTDNVISDNIYWLNGKSREEKDRLKKYLLNLDTSKRVDPNSERRNKVIQGVTDIVETIRRRMEGQDSRLRGKLVPMGSANNDTKIGDSDEADFIYELDLDYLLKGKGTLKRFDDEYGAIVVEIDGPHDWNIVKKSVLSDYSSIDSSIDTSIEAIVLDTVNIESIFRDVLLKMLCELELPPGWRHGGFNQPNFSGLHRQGPSNVLQFDYLNTSDQVPLCLSVDFVPMIKIPIPADVATSRLNCFLKTETKIKHCWVSIDDTGAGLFYGHAEELFLKQFSAESIPKTLMRIAKALRTFLRITSPKYPSEEYVGQVLDAMVREKSGEKETDILKLKNYQVTRVDYMIDIPGAEDYATYQDLGETIGDECMVKSYYIKQIVLLMMCVDESHGRDWTDDDLPDLVMTVYMLLKDTIKPYMYAFPNISLVETTFSPPLEETTERTNPEGSTQSTPEERLTRDDESKDPKIYTDTLSAIKEGKMEFKVPVRFIHSRLSNIFQLFRNVCEGKKTAQIVFYKHLSPNRAGKLLFKKREFERLKQKHGLSLADT